MYRVGERLYLCDIHLKPSIQKCLCREYFISSQVDEQNTHILSHLGAISMYRYNHLPSLVSLLEAEMFCLKISRHLNIKPIKLSEHVHILQLERIDVTISQTKAAINHLCLYKFIPGNTFV